MDSLLSLPLKDCQIICVDSGSSDNTVDLICNYKDQLQGLELYQIDGVANASVCRNVGLELANRSYIFFVDGDIEVNREFITSAIDEIIVSDVDAVTGKLEEYQYDAKFRTVSKKILDRFNIHERQPTRICGGCFIAKREVIVDTGYYVNSYKKNQDIDYSLRLSRKHKLVEIPVSMGIHHTVAYENTLRMKNEFFTSYRYYGKLLMKNLRYPKSIYALLKRYSGITYGFLYYIFAVLLVIFQIDYWGYTMMAILVTDIAYGKIQGKSIVYRLYLHYICPLTTLVSALLPLRRVDTSNNKLDRII